MGRRTGYVVVLCSALAVGCGDAGTSASGQVPTCTIGPALDEQLVLEPKRRTFYAVDVLNPDVIRRGGRYWMFFSGNDRRSDAGRWHTGVAVADRPTGPFRVSPRLRAPFLNGGTAESSGAIYQAASAPRSLGPKLFRSRRGYRWRPISTMPPGPEGSWRRIESDMYLLPRLQAYWVGRPGPSGADIGTSRYKAGKWFGFRRVLVRGAPGDWDHADLGEPAVFTANGRTFMLYGGLAAPGQPRQIGLALREDGRWVKCGLAIAADRRWYRQNAIDPEPLVVRNRLYVYYGGGIRPSLGGNMDGRIGVRVYDLANVG